MSTHSTKQRFSQDGYLVCTLYINDKGSHSIAICFKEICCFSLDFLYIFQVFSKSLGPVPFSFRLLWESLQVLRIPFFRRKMFIIFMDIATLACINSASPHKQYTDDKTKLQATAIINDCYKYNMDLTTNGVVVTDAIKYVTQKQEQIDILQKLDERI